MSDVPALYDLAPLRATLASLVDFDLLNSGSIRVVIAATDVLTGERVIFDTARGDIIGLEHILACCALMPIFAPVEINGRLLADGGLASNVPLDVVLTGQAACSSRCFVVDLFAAEGSRPHTLAASASRAGDLAFGNQSKRLLEGIVREHRLRALIGRMGSLLPPEYVVILISQPYLRRDAPIHQKSHILLIELSSMRRDSAKHSTFRA